MNSRSLAKPLQIELLGESDLDAALRLSTQAGWNQSRADWLRLLKLNPSGCLAGRVDGRLVATATLAEYPGHVIWIGMVIVDEACRGQGIGKQILTAALDRAHMGEGDTIVGLDATEFGHPVYRKHGFVDICPMDSWTGRLAPSGPARRVRPGNQADLNELIVYDREACGVDRSALLRELTTEPGNAWWVLADNGAIEGYVFVRPGRTYWRLGPCCADKEAGLSHLLDAAAEKTGGELVVMDAVRHESAVRMMEKHGIQVDRRLTRMAHPRPAHLFMGERVWLATAFEWG